MQNKITWTTFRSKLHADVWPKIFMYLEDSQVVRFLMRKFFINILDPQDPNRDMQKISQAYFLGRIMCNIQHVFKQPKLDAPVLHTLLEHQEFLDQYLKQYNQNISTINRDFFDAYCLHRWSTLIHRRISLLDVAEPPPLTPYEALARKERLILGELIQDMNIILKRPQESKRLYFIVSMLPIAHHCFIQKSKNNLYDQGSQSINSIQLCIKIALNTHDIQKLASALEQARPFIVDNNAIYHEVIYKIINLDNYQRIFFQDYTCLYQNMCDALFHALHLRLHYNLFTDTPFFLSGFLSGWQLVKKVLYLMFLVMLRPSIERLRKHPDESWLIFLNSAFFLSSLRNSLFLPFLFFLYTLPCSTWRLGQYYWDGKQNQVARTLMTMIQMLQEHGIMPPENLQALLAQHGDKPIPACFMNALTQNSATWFATAARYSNNPRNPEIEAMEAGLDIKKHN